MYAYLLSEPGLWTVGFFAPDGKWHPDYDYNDREEAAQRVAYLNGSTPTVLNKPDKQKEQPIKAREAVRLLGISNPTLYTWIKKGIVPAHRIGRQWYFYKSQLIDITKSH